MNLNIKKVSVPVLMFLMAQSGFGVSNANFGNANLALAQNNEIGQARAVRCLTEEAIKKDEANSDDDFTELRKLLVNKDESALEEIGKLLRSAYIEYLVPRSDPNDAVRKALANQSSVEEMVETLVDTNLFTKYDNEGRETTSADGKYLWWTIDGYDNATEGTIKWKFNQVVEEILDGTSDNYNWKDISGENKDDQKKINAKLLKDAITTKYGTGDSEKSIADLTEEDFKNGGWEIPGEDAVIPEGWKWNSVLNEINGIVSEIGNDRSKATHEEKESIIDALQVFLGDVLMDKLIDAGKTEKEDRDGEIRTALGNFFEGHFMRKVADCPEISKGEAFSNAFKWADFYVKLALEIERKSETPNEIYCKNGIYDRAYEAIHSDIEGLLRNKGTHIDFEMIKENGNIDGGLFKKTLVNQLDNLAPDGQGTRSWDKIEDTDLKKQLKRIVWIDDDDNDVTGAKESDNESYDYDSSDINGGDSDEEQAERAEEAVKEGLENADKLIDNQ